MGNITFKTVKSILNDICELNYADTNINERYLHHYFTKNIQEKYPIVLNSLTESKLHPEWATAIKDIREGGIYKKADNREYQINDEGRTGYIDFVLGNYNHPELGVEFKLIKSWNFQSIVFDYMKLLDNKNNINQAISFTMILRQERLSNKLKTILINETIQHLKKRLGKRLATDRPFFFRIVEVSTVSNEKRIWKCTNLEDGFAIQQALNYNS